MQVKNYDKASADQMHTFLQKIFVGSENKDPLYLYAYLLPVRH